jgi:hypothetical protein
MGMTFEQVDSVSFPRRCRLDELYTMSWPRNRIVVPVTCHLQWQEHMCDSPEEAVSSLKHKAVTPIPSMFALIVNEDFHMSRLPWTDEQKNQLIDLIRRA